MAAIALLVTSFVTLVKSVTQATLVTLETFVTSVTLVTIVTSITSLSTFQIMNIQLYFLPSGQTSITLLELGSAILAPQLVRWHFLKSTIGFLK